MQLPLISRLAHRFSVLILFLFWSIQVYPQALNYNAASPEIIRARLEQYQGDDQQREGTLKRLFNEAGCEGDHISEQPVKDSKVPNIICVLPGTSNRVIVVGAHFDHSPNGDGVIDNWSGASLLTSLYGGLKTAPHKHSYIFVGFTDAERGRFEGGAHFYASKMPKEEANATDAMVNIDTLGLGHPVVWDREDKPLTKILLSLAKQLNVEVSCNTSLEFLFDSVDFSERRIPSITITSLTQNAIDAGIAKTPKDKMSAMRFDNYYQSYELLAAYLALLDQVTR